MILRSRVGCSTCKKPHTIRIQIGHEKKQNHVFCCVGCEEEISIQVDCTEPPNVSIQYLENAEKCNSDGTIVNLSSEFPIRANQINSDLVFPAHEHINKILEAQKILRLQARNVDWRF